LCFIDLCRFSPAYQHEANNRGKTVNDEGVCRKRVGTANSNKKINGRCSQFALTENHGFQCGLSQNQAIG
jgi:hypothetical protein